MHHNADAVNNNFNMLGANNPAFRRKRASEYITLKKSPYFSSIRKKNKPSHEQLSITKYDLPDHQSPKQKKKMFKRINKFFEGEAEPLHRLKKEKSYDRHIVNSIKTLSLVTKYQSYKSIPLTPKAVEREHKVKKFRTKTKVGNSMAVTKENNDDWLCKEIIQNEVYATEEDYDC